MHYSPLHGKILPIALPTILMNISLPLLGAVDTAVVGHLDEVYLVGAVGIGSMIFSVLYWAFGFLRMSVVGLAAQSHGAGDRTESMAILCRGLVMALVMGAILILARDGIVWAAMGLIEASPDVERHAAAYVQIRLLAAPAVFIGMVFTGWFYGTQNIWLPVVIQVGINALNVALDLYFVRELGLKSDGVAWATVISQYCGLLIFIAVMVTRYRSELKWVRAAVVFDKAKLRRLFTMNANLFVRTASLLSAHSYFLSRSAAHGDLILAATTVLIQFRHITSYSLDGFATAAEVVVGATLGSGRVAENRQAIRLTLGYGMAVGCCFAIFYFAAGGWLITLFTKNAEVLALAGTYLFWIVLEPFISNICFMLDGIFIGATATRTMRNAMVFSVFVVYFPLFLWVEPLFGMHGMWAVTLILYAVRGATLGWPMAKLMRGTTDRLV